MKISPAEAQAKMAEGHTYIDVRTPEEFGEGRPKDSINVPLGESFVADVASRFAKDAKLIVGCKAGGRSAKAHAALTAAGFTNVLDQRAGYDGARGAFGEITEPGWSRAGLPTET